MSDALALYEIKDQVAIVTINHPPVNALDAATKEAIADVFRELDDRRHEIRAAILRGGGPKAFAAGADIKAFLEYDPEIAKRRLTQSHRCFAVVENFVWPVIAAIHGFCLGGGLEMALCCDIRYAEESAKLGFPEVNLSIFPGNGGTKRALYHLPLGKIKELTYTGAMIEAKEALSLGLVEKVVPDGQVMDAALDLARSIMQKGPLGVAAAKKALNRTRDLGIEQALELESDLWSALAGTEDMKEGAKAFLEKRKPDYRCK
jgi:enoyl-CoA hydratase/carnithine racemase